jgi:hypothetical protein
MGPLHVRTRCRSTGSCFTCWLACKCWVWSLWPSRLLAARMPLSRSAPAYVCQTWSWHGLELTLIPYEILVMVVGLCQARSVPAADRCSKGGADARF